MPARAWGLYGNIQLLELGIPDNVEIISIRKGIERLINEVAIQKDFSQHKDSNYTAVTTAVLLSDIKRELGLIISGHTASTQKKITQDWPEKDVILKTDALLLSRIIGNMVINALEATPKGDYIQINVSISQEDIVWEIWNKSFIPLHIQKRIFQRHFSSKSGSGRGLGTYSMKLFGETYLKGKISFQSTRDHGTIFTYSLPYQTMPCEK